MGKSNLKQFYIERLVRLAGYYMFVFLFHWMRADRLRCRYSGSVPKEWCESTAANLPKVTHMIRLREEITKIVW